MFVTPRVWVYWGSRKGSPIWAADLKFIPNREAAPSLPSNFRLQNQRCPMPAKEIRILLADDHNVMRAGLKLLLESHQGFKVISEASDGNQAVANAVAARPDIVVLDIAM